MKKIQLLLLFLLTVCLYKEANAQSCGTPIPLNPIIYSGDANARGASSAHCIDVFFHIVRNTDGTNAFTPPNTNTITAELNRFFSPHNIILNNSGTAFINNSNFVNIDGEAQAATLGQTNNNSNAINYYIVESLWPVNNGTIAGTANSIPSNNLVIRNDRVFTSTSPHEFGHCLNLLHTHETANGVEAINGSNCSIAGDLICDTPADPRLSAGNNVDLSCVYTGGNGFDPSTVNIMSYSFPVCRNEFTIGQGLRMRTAISEETLLQQTTSNNCVKISQIDNNVCFPQTRAATLTDLGGAITTWTSSANVQITASNNSSASFRAIRNRTSGDGWIRATLNNGVELTEEFWVGRPRTPAFLIGPTLVQTGAFVNYSGGEAKGAISYDWRLPYPFETVSSFNLFGPNWQMTPTTGKTLHAFTGYSKNEGYVQVMGVNGCGSGGAKLLYVKHAAGGGGAIPRLGSAACNSCPLAILSPIPAKDRLEVQFLSRETHKTLKENYDEEREYLIYDLFGNLLSSFKSNAIKVRIDLQHITKNGVYTLIINHGEHGSNYERFIIDK